MASIGHAIVGAAAARLLHGTSPAPRRFVVEAAVYAGLALLPDLDVIGFRFGVEYTAPFGHRGASHSLLVAVVVGALAGWLLARPGERRPLRVLVTIAVVMSHGLLDTLTTGGEGVGLLWPFSDERFFAPWRPIPVAPIGLGFLSPRGAKVAVVELVELAPLLLWALWPRRARRPGPPASIGSA